MLTLQTHSKVLRTGVSLLGPRLGIFCSAALAESLSDRTSFKGRKLDDTVVLMKNTTTVPLRSLGNNKGTLPFTPHR